MADYLKMKALVSSQVLKQKNLEKSINQNFCDFTTGTTIELTVKPTIHEIHSVNDSVEPLYKIDTCASHDDVTSVKTIHEPRSDEPSYKNDTYTIFDDNATIYNTILNIEDKYAKLLFLVFVLYLQFYFVLFCQYVYL